MNDIENKDSIVVGIELGSSKITAAAGKMKEGTMQVIAYAEERATDCIRRGVVYNIEKTTQCIKNVIAKLETTLKQQVTQVYIGVDGQSVQSVVNVIKRDMQIPTCINQTHITDIEMDGSDIPFDDYELLDSYPQEYTVDSSVVTDPVGIVATHITGQFVNVIANRRLKENIVTCFDNTDINIAGYVTTSTQQAKSVVGETEKRSGCAVIDFGAGTTSIVVYKNNLLRYVSTVPLGFNNIIQDLVTLLQIEKTEATQILLNYGTGSPDDYFQDNDIETSYTTTDGRQIKISEILYIIDARLNEILENIRYQVTQSGYATQLLGGLFLVGGGSNLKNIDRAIMRTIKIDKIRIVRKLEVPLIKNSNISNLNIENGASSAILSILVSGTDNCVGERVSDPDIFVQQQTQEEIIRRKTSAATIIREEEDAVTHFEAIKGKLRQAIVQLQQKDQELSDDLSNKRLRDEAEDLIIECTSIIGDDYSQCVQILKKKDKYKMTLKEAEDLIFKRDRFVDELSDTITQSSKETSFLNRVKQWLNDLVNEKE